MRGAAFDAVSPIAEAKRPRAFRAFACRPLHTYVETLRIVPGIPASDAGSGRRHRQKPDSFLRETDPRHDRESFAVEKSCFVSAGQSRRLPPYAAKLPAMTFHEITYKDRNQDH
jgi:hypothetical protein